MTNCAICLHALHLDDSYCHCDSYQRWFKYHDIVSCAKFQSIPRLKRVYISPRVFVIPPDAAHDFFHCIYNERQLSLF